MRVVRFMIGSFLPLTSMVSWDELVLIDFRIFVHVFDSPLGSPSRLQPSRYRALWNIGSVNGWLWSKGSANLPASNIDDDITVGELGDRLTNDSLAATESTRNADGTTLDTREEGVQDSLSDNERRVGAELVNNRSRHTNGPLVHHAVFRLLSVKLDLENLLIDSVAAGLGDSGDGTACSWGKEDLVVVEKGVLVDGTEDITTSYVVADLEVAGLEVPLLGAVQGRDVDTAGNVDTF